MAKLIKGMRVAYTRSFLKSIGNTFDYAQRRGKYNGMVDGSTVLAHVVWDDISEEDLTRVAAQYGKDYAALVREHGSIVNISNICGTKHKGFIE